MTEEDAYTMCKRLEIWYTDDEAMSLALDRLEEIYQDVFVTVPVTLHMPVNSNNNTLPPDQVLIAFAW